ncbi:MAG: AmmeMemoRadiSam system protein B, partial [Burkholderiales bacterium]
GYVYSGPVAASVYVRLQPFRQRISRVVLLGPAHRAWVSGLALPEEQAFATPLGEVCVDREACALIRKLAQISVSTRAHALEHSLEVQLPFLQTVLEHFSIVPLAVGDVTAQQVCEVLELLWGGPETLIVISSDLSHYLPYATAQAVDHTTAQSILGLQSPLSHQQACGATPINGLLLAARRRGLSPQLVDLRNSGDTAGSRDQVVGYAGFIFTEVAAHAQ